MVTKAKAVMVPFGYPDYPNEFLERFTKESQKMVSNLGIDVTVTPIVKVWADTGKAAAEIQKQDYDFIIVVILSWLEAPNLVETLQDYFHKPVLLWSHTMFYEGKKKFTLGPMAAAGVIRQTFEELGLNFRFVYGMPDEEKVRQAVSSFARIAYTRHKLTHSKIGLLGYISMGMYTAAFDHLPLKQNLGPEVEQLDQYVLIKKIEEIEEQRVQEIKKIVRKKWEISKAVQDSDLDITLRMYLALKDLVQEFGWSALTIKCQYELSKYYKHVPCVPLSMIGNEMPCSCEGDIPLITTQLIMHHLSGGKIISYGDVHTIEEKIIILGACGFAPLELGEGKPKVDKTTTLYTGLANCTVYKEGRVTIARLAYTRERKFKMHIAGGQAHHAEPFREVGCLPYPTMAVTLEGDTENFGRQLMSQHYAIVYGDLRSELGEFCKMADIEEVRP